MFFEFFPFFLHAKYESSKVATIDPNTQQKATTILRNPFTEHIVIKKIKNMLKLKIMRNLDNS